MDPRIFSYEADGKTYEWEVRRLWRLASRLPAKFVEIKTFQKQLDLWIGYNSYIDKNNVTVTPLPIEEFERIRKADLAYPIIVNASGLYIMDGMHRLVKTWLSGGERIRVCQFTVDPEPDRVY